MEYKLRLVFNQTVITTAIALGCIVGIINLQQPQLKYLTQKAKNTSPEFFQQEVKAEQLRLQLLKKMPTFGYNNIFADWVFLQFAQYFGDDLARSTTGYELSSEYFDIIIDRDPRFLQSYLFLSASVSLYAGNPEKSVNLMEKGLKFLSPKVPQRSYYVWRYKGIDELLFLGNYIDAKKSFLKTAEWASVYNDEESKYVGYFSEQSAQFLENNPNSKYAQINAWGMILSNPVDKKTRERAIREIEKLGGKVIIDKDGKIGIQPPEKD
jgi:hypothetical protein